MVYKREPNASLLIMIWSKSLSSVVKLAHYIRSSLLVMKAWDKIIIEEWKVFENQLKKNLTVLRLNELRLFNSFFFFSFLSTLPSKHLYLSSNFFYLVIQRFMWDHHCSTTNLFRIRFSLLLKKRGTQIHRSFLALKFLDSFLTSQFSHHSFNAFYN